ncbi:RelB/DinJ family addiction module antitoxin [Brachyspira hampsonii 30446]|uniref:RelB/DinJ family addiction module antitoxin n=1 Tax=Brachyspira hampsonii 30446 TaxID=1289135 RepID=A0A2U4FBI3_9SPIR|nr:type II toxin-antitoxin system RelB/DinJ family antitoxin [Brachyspira hampsonii]EKV56764.1 RelB/DinJ family addiction module antitoxin [Brachyspira hampsonii 30446]MBW5395860.1 type II toxin-antitoxin system RelB/DinJ family antitoxin [Brachyspira hampsonii]OEJ20520.1 damage-inducible protein J [Brachyspira hampsonii]
MSEVTIKIDDKLKNEADKLFNDLGLDFNTAINIFLRTSINTQSIPFKIEVNKQLYTDNDNFYNEENIKFLKEGYLELKSGLGHKRELLNE